MSDKKINLGERYKLANCCRPEPDDLISGYYSYNNEVIVHKSDCPNLLKVEDTRIMKLDWQYILVGGRVIPDADFSELDELDFKILNHHNAYGIDYSLKVASMLNADKQVVFECHNKLREMKLLKRVKKLMIQYRKGIAGNKWIKHRNHTYYELTNKGKLYLEHYIKNRD